MAIGKVLEVIDMPSNEMWKKSRARQEFIPIIQQHGIPV